MADVIVQVLDARDPIGCREPSVEQLVTSQGKRLILLLNKIDLVPKENALAWVKYLKRFFPTVPFKASTQLQRTNLGHSSFVENSSDNAQNSSGSDCCYGSEDVLSLLKNYSRSHNSKTCITVGVVGMPNVGKSSFINSLKRSKVCQVGSTPGITRNIQEISLDRNIKLIDSPGIVFGSGIDSVLRNTVKLDHVDDLNELVGCILKKTSVHVLRKVYRIDEGIVWDWDDIGAFLLVIAKTCGKLRKGGVYDLEGAARTIIQDWNNAKIPFYSVPPVSQDTEIESSILGELGVPFELKDTTMEIC